MRMCSRRIQPALCKTLTRLLRKLHNDTVFQHFTTSFRFFPWLRALTVKPWQIERVQQELKLHEYDELLAEYARLMPEMG